MIASLRGKVAARLEGQVVLEVAGVGFLVHMPRSTLSGLSESLGELKLFTYLHVRENDLSLFGFATPQELAFFQLLLGVSGIGPKTALNILSHASPDALERAILGGDVEALLHIPGIGRKTAERLVLDLKGKIDRELPLPRAAAPDDAEVLEALLSLGYTRPEAEAALRALPRGDVPLEERIRLALQRLGA